MLQLSVRSAVVSGRTQFATGRTGQARLNRRQSRGRGWHSRGTQRRLIPSPAASSPVGGRQSRCEPGRGIRRQNVRRSRPVLAVLLIIVSYVLGTFPSAILIARANGIEISSVRLGQPGSVECHSRPRLEEGHLGLHPRRAEGWNRHWSRAWHGVRLGWHGPAACLRLCRSGDSRPHVSGLPALQRRQGCGVRVRRDHGVAAGARPRHSSQCGGPSAKSPAKPPSGRS